jgi:hypothetical protein
VEVSLTCSHRWSASRSDPAPDQNLLRGCLRGNAPEDPDALVVAELTQVLTGRSTAEQVGLLAAATTAGRNGKGLAEILTDAAQALLGERGGEKLHRAVNVSYFKGAPTREIAAELLGPPFGTYRRHLTTAVERITELLWLQELNGQ